MAVQQNRVTRSKRNMRRAHDFLKHSELSVDSNSGEFHIRHQLTKTGFYRGRQLIKAKDATETVEE